MSLDDPANDRKAEAKALDSRTGAIEFLKYALTRIGWYAWPLVLDLDARFSVASQRSQSDRFSLGRILNGIVHEIIDRLCEGLFVAAGGWHVRLHINQSVATACQLSG